MGSRIRRVLRGRCLALTCLGVFSLALLPAACTESTTAIDSSPTIAAEADVCVECLQCSPGPNGSGTGNGGTGGDGNGKGERSKGEEGTQASHCGGITGGGAAGGVAAACSNWGFSGDGGGGTGGSGGNGTPPPNNETPCCEPDCSTGPLPECACGDGVVDWFEWCDGDCPTSCPGETCGATYALVGSADTCNAHCEATGVCIGDETCCVPIGGACADGESICVQGDIFGICLKSAPHTQLKDSYCSALCNDETACPAGSHCVDLRARLKDPGHAPKLWGKCLADCSDDSACRPDGYACYDFDVDGGLECYVSGTGSGELGASCKTAADCAGGNFVECWLGRCRRTCDNGACPEAMVCHEEMAVYGSQPFCHPVCESDSDCTGPSFEGHCWGDNNGATFCDDQKTRSTIGLACEAVDCADGQCTKSLGLLGPATNGEAFCTQKCDDGEACPGGSHCVNLSHRLIDPSSQAAQHNRYCLADCQQSEDCSPGDHACYDFDEDGVTECYRAGTGTVKLSESCEGPGDCAGGSWVGCFAQKCLQECSDKAPCPEGRTCGPLIINLTVCHLNCDNDDDCDDEILMMKQCQSPGSPDGLCDEPEKCYCD
jgi:hypothetical protein